MVPTYQEAPNVERFLRTVRETVPEVDLIVVDDNSPDGTGEIAERVAAELGRVRVLHRRAKEGLGAAYREGFRTAIDAGYDVIVQMDCDFSHDPAVIPTLLGLVADGADCAIGSRYVPGGSTPGWPLHRKLLSRWGNRYTAFTVAERGPGSKSESSPNIWPGPRMASRFSRPSDDVRPSFTLPSRTM